MNRNSVDWQGPMPAVITPFDDRGRIHEAAMRANVDRVFEAGASGILVGGCTGEFWSLSFEERCELFKLGADAAAGRGTVLAGTGAVTPAETVELTRHASDAGCDGALVLPPYFIRLSDDEVFEYFVEVDAASPLPIVLYNIPGNAINAITPELAGRLAALDNVVAIKESSGDWNNFYGTLLKVRDQIRVFCGPSSIFGVPAVAAWSRRRHRLLPEHVAARRARPLSTLPARRAIRNEANRAPGSSGRRLTDLCTTGGTDPLPRDEGRDGHALGCPGVGVPAHRHCSHSPASR